MSGTAIILIIFIVASIAPWVLFCICGSDEEGIILGSIEQISIFVIIFRIIVLFILFGVYLGFFIYYKVKFETDFFKCYEGINNSNEQTSFKEYYNSLFELKLDLLIIIILKPINFVISLCFVIFHFYSCSDI